MEINERSRKTGILLKYLAVQNENFKIKIKSLDNILLMGELHFSLRHEKSDN